jgi:hypothetical protein
MIWLKGFTAFALALWAWQSFRATPKPVIKGGKRWYRQPDARFKRWYGGKSRSAEELGLLEDAGDR